ncbi:phospholipase D-like domain-containing protein [Fictibacillus iocasae]|uniref:phospholipase D n=1 Tax=Fictibacillus iocasae TaxID=2715437 RepID=A0ABW2NPN7_9BACL
MKWKASMAAVLAAAALIPKIAPSQNVHAAANAPVISEIAWMGTTADANDEWIELYNPTNAAIDLTGWKLASADGTPSVALKGSIGAGKTFLLERTDDNTVTGVKADQIYTGALSNTAESLTLTNSSNAAIDSVDKWHAGDAASKATMVRKDITLSGTNANAWKTSSAGYDTGFGTPGYMESTSNGQPEQLNQVNNNEGAINIYFNKSALPQYASPGNAANYHVNLENRLINRINSATSSIDIATYEINLPNVVKALMDKAASGVKVRMIADAKPPSDPEHDERYELMRMYLEKLLRGNDGQLNTADDSEILADSAMFAVENETKRADLGLPVTGYNDFSSRTVTIGSSAQTGHFMVDGESKAANSYYAPDDQMHNKFLIIDGRWVYTGSWNFTTSGLYGTDENRAAGILDGNTNHSVEINSPQLATIYKTEFDEMWGSGTLAPNTDVSNFGSRKTDNTPHTLTIGGRTVEVYFSPGDNAVPKMVQTVTNEANYNTYFSIFAWSDQELVDALKMKWEGSAQDMQGSLTGFDLKGVFESSYWNMWWSASVDMTGRTATQTSTNNPNTRWKNPAPVYSDNEVRKHHHKYMIIDTDTASDPTVITGSTNWSTNGNDVNDENSLWIHDASITNQFKQEFLARFQQAGGTVQ